MDDDVDLRTMRGSEDLLKNKSCWHGGREPVTGRRMEELGSVYALQEDVWPLYSWEFRGFSVIISSLWDNQLEPSLLAGIEDSEHWGASLCDACAFLYITLAPIFPQKKNFSTNPMRCLYLHAEKINGFTGQLFV